MQPGARPPWWAYACLAASMALVGSYVALAKLLVAVFPVFLLAGLRCAIAAPVMAHWLRSTPGEPVTSAREQALLFALALFGNVLFSVCMLYGVAMSSALAAGVVMAALPAVVALLSWLGLGERIRPAVALGIACAVVAVALLAFAHHGGPGGPSAPLGVALLLGAVLCEALYVVIAKRLAGSLSARRLSASMNLWGLALLAPLALWQALDFDFRAVTPALWSLLLFYALAASVASVWLWMLGLRHVSAASAGVYTVLLPLSAAAVGVLLLGESASALQGLALLLALAGLLLASRPAQAKSHRGAALP